MSDILAQMRALLLKSSPASAQVTDQTVLANTNAPSLDPHDVRDLDAQGPAPRLSTTAEPAPVHVAPPVTLSSIAKKTTKQQISGTTFLSYFGRIWIARPPRKLTSTFMPNSRMMFYILHEMALLMMDSFQLNRSCPMYHPILLRIYLAQIFFIQTLRCMQLSSVIAPHQRLFLSQFLEQHRPETMPIPGPLLHIFKAITCSQPEQAIFGLISPAIKDNVGPNNAGLTNATNHLAINSSSPALLPQVPLLVAFDFLGHTFVADTTTWNDIDAYALTSPGLDYSIEQTAALHTRLRDNAPHLALPTVDLNRDFSQIENFLCLSGNRSYFKRLCSMVNGICDFWPGSGTIADCPVNGLQTGQILSQIIADPEVNNDVFARPAQIFHVNDDNSNSEWFTAIHTTTAYGIPKPVEILSSASLINIEVQHHPFYTNAGTYVANNAGSHRTGPYWTIAPEIGRSPTDEQYQVVPDAVSASFLRGNVAGRTQEIDFATTNEGTTPL